MCSCSDTKIDLRAASFFFLHYRLRVMQLVLDLLCGALVLSMSKRLILKVQEPLLG